MSSKLGMTMHDSMPWSRKRRHVDLPGFLKKIGNNMKLKFGVVKAALKLKVSAEMCSKAAEDFKYDQAERHLDKCREYLKDLESAMKAAKDMDKKG